MAQISIFDGSQPLKITKPIRLIELFAGYGSQHFALEYLGANFQSWRICEWAVKSIQAYKDAHCKEDRTDYSLGIPIEVIEKDLLRKGISQDYNQPMNAEQIHRMGEKRCRTVYNNILATHNLVSVCNTHAEDLGITDTEKYTYVMTYSFPCQDLSKAGKAKGMAKGSGTRSGMLWEVERILDECKHLPQILLMENVPDVIGTKNAKDFGEWLQKLDSLGYRSVWKVLNAKDYGVPQNRERCFMVSFLGDYFFEFPEPIKLEKRLVHLLEDDVPQKYYLKPETVEYFIRHTKEMKENGNGFKFSPIDCSQSVQVERERESRTHDNNESREQNGRHVRQGVIVTNKGKTITRSTDIAMTLMARDYKGFGNQEMTGVLECVNAKKQVR